jgi:hypothetical protein
VVVALENWIYEKHAATVKMPACQNHNGLQQLYPILPAMSLLFPQLRNLHKHLIALVRHAVEERI